MAGIGFIVPNEEMLSIAADALGRQRDIRIRAGLATEAAAIAGALIAAGAEIIIARAETARTLKHSTLQVPIVEVPITISDLIHAIEAVKETTRPSGAENGGAGGRARVPDIAVVCFPTMVYDLEWLGRLLGVTLHKYLIVNADEVERAVLSARDAGNDSVIGGGISIKFAQKHGFPSALIPMGKEAILLAAQHAQQIKAAMDLARERNILINTVFENAYEGIVTIDAKRHVTSFNPTAERLTKISRAAALGARIDTIWPSLELDASAKSDARDADHIVEIGDTRLVCFKAPIVVNHDVIGAVATFQEAARIEKMEAAIRKKTYAKGHLANYTFRDIIGSSRAIMEAIDVARDYANARFSVLILGETGTGKEVFAQSIHNASRSAEGPFVAINCASLPGQILESELFGYVAGAFTGASRDGKPGLFEVAHNGTIFLDEIGEMDYANQGRLLRFLQEKTVRRLGSDRNIPVNVRIISATNKDLETLVREKSFREDLFYRLNVLSFTLPSLRERASDIGRFADYFLDKYAKERERQLKIDPAARKILESFPWPGNVRQFENFVARMVITSKSDRIDKEQVESMLAYRRPVVEDEPKVRQIKRALAESGGKYLEAAAILGVDRSTLWRWLKHYRIERR